MHFQEISYYRCGGFDVAVSLADCQRAFLLLQLLGADERRLTQTAANKCLKAEVKKKLGLDARTANQLRNSLAEDGYLEKSRADRATSYALTERGLALLLSLEQYPTELVVSGKAINALIAAVQEQSGSWQGAGHVDRTVAAAQTTLAELERGVSELFHNARQRLQARPSPPEKLETPDLADVLWSEFQELHRERFGHSGLVPIHELRRRVAARLGAQAARHDVFDAEVQRLRQRGRVRLVPISDLRDASREQLNDSIPGVSETLFYLEPVHEPAALG